MLYRPTQFAHVELSKSLCSWWARAAPPVSYLSHCRRPSPSSAQWYFHLLHVASAILLSSFQSPPQPTLIIHLQWPLADLPACTPVLRELLSTQRIVQPLDLPGASCPSEDQFCSPDCGPVVRPAPLVLVSHSPLRALRFRLRARCSLGAVHGSVARLL